jgi:uncharacterized protein YdaU (DUF1376 family)
MELYVGDYLRDTSHLSPAHNGCYLLLIFHYWQKGMLQASPEQCARIARASTEVELQALKEVLAEFFVEQDGRYINGRLESELVKFKAKRGKASSKAAVAAEARWAAERERAANAHGNAPSIGQAMPEQCPPTPTPAVKSKEKAGAATRGTRLPKDWEPSAEDKAYAVERQVDWKKEAEAFKDWWIAAAGAKGVKLDWAATWRTWVRRAPKVAQPLAPSKPSKPAGPSETPLERAIAYARNRFALTGDAVERDRLIADATEKHRGNAQC